MRNRITRLFTVLVAGMALAAGACAADPEPGSGNGGPTSPPQSGGTFTIALPNYPQRGLNPHYGAAFDASQVLRNSYDSLVAEDRNEQFHPWLATEWTVSPDGTVYEFTLRTDVTFHNGEKFDAHAVKANIDLLRNPDSPSWTVLGLLQYSSVSSVDVLDPYKVRITLSTPRADFLSTLAGLSGAIVAPSTLTADKQTVTSGTGLVGTGPFILDKAVQGQELEFRKNPDYRWGPATARHQGAAYVDKVVVKYIPEASTRAGLLRSGEVDAIGTVKATDIPLFDGIDGFQYEQIGSAAAPTVIMLNLTNGPTTDLRVRRAIAKGVDIAAVVDSLTKGSQKRAWSLISPDSAYYDPKYENKGTADIAAADALLDEAGWTGTDADGYRTDSAGRRLTIRLLATVPTYPEDDFLEAWQAELRQNLGVQVELQFVENAQVYDLLARNQYEAFPRQVGGLDLSLQFNRAYGSTSPDLKYGQIDGITIGSIVAGSKLADPEVDRWLVESTKATDREQRKQLFDKITGYLLDKAVAIPLYTDRNSVAASSAIHHVTSLFDPPRNSVNAWAYDIAVR
ncbi:ABC transporter substrate-binding protein [Nocardia bhagyanarayanae]|uniref:Peptide/nickel transport system substrate-binding protein n=1 Tax=Nocardia bhagyanarayanae TaxID=1215925 RepID=A0A543FDK3_9NOCA|nr:ABC transporter substrate-binding protein [Nocardia bhagyanarayanae]TQM31917.1 peptide/nickel transport system substrate-binding protein [Nocardia bhagyanarayanae]